MCFSASASFVAAASLSAVGVVSLRKTTRAAEVPLAMIPVLFGAQQFTEGLVWLSFGYDAPRLGRVATYAYSFFSHTLWPIFVPFAVALLERARWRRRGLALFEVVGLAVGLYLLYFIVRYPVTARVVERHIIYVSPHFYLPTVMVLYFSATCLSFLVSSHPLLKVFGVLALATAIVAYHFAAAAFVSVWCFFAAVLSLVIYLHFARPMAARDPSVAPA